MSSVRLGAAWALVAFSAWACGPSAPSSPTPTAVPTPEPSPKVAIISIDGLRPDALGLGGAPTIQALAQRGAYTWQAQTVMPSSTLPGHASMVSGYEPSVHGLTWDDYRPERGTITVPTMFAIAHEAGLRTAMVIGKAKLNHLNTPGTIDRPVFTSQGDASVASEAVQQAAAGVDLLFVHFPQTDYTGHSQGWMSAAYLQQLADTDQAVAQVLLALPAETTVIVTADHGGHGNTHGSSASVDTTIPWIIAGPAVQARGQLATKVKTTDTAATALSVLGLSVRANATGRPVTEAFTRSDSSQSSGVSSLAPAAGVLPAAGGPALFERPGPRPERSRARRPAR
jgi:arylsulfatase A-like enzyme